MLTIPEIASQVVNEALSEGSEDSSRTIFLVGSKSVVFYDTGSKLNWLLYHAPPYLSKDAKGSKNIVATNKVNRSVTIPNHDKGKSTMLSSFLEKNENLRETLVLEYSFGRKSVNKQSVEKTICHVWEFGGKLDILDNVLASIPARGKFYYCVMVDLSKIKNIWKVMETCITVMNETFTENENSPEVIIIGGKYDIFKNYDNDIKKVVCSTIRSVALVCNAHLFFYSSKEPPLVKRAKEVLYSIGFGCGFLIKEKNVNFAKPLVISKGSDSWENIGVPPSTMDTIKARHHSRIPPEAEAVVEDESVKPHLSHPEPVLDSLVSAQYEELRNKGSFNITVNDYLLAL